MRGPRTTASPHPTASTKREHVRKVHSRQRHHRTIHPYRLLLASHDWTAARRHVTGKPRTEMKNDQYTLLWL
jgi:hypothetical protein